MRVVRRGRDRRAQPRVAHLERRYPGRRAMDGLLRVTRPRSSRPRSMRGCRGRGHRGRDELHRTVVFIQGPDRSRPWPMSRAWAARRAAGHAWHGRGTIGVVTDLGDFLRRRTAPRGRLVGVGPQLVSITAASIAARGASGTSSRCAPATAPATSGVVVRAERDHPLAGAQATRARYGTVFHYAARPGYTGWSSAEPSSPRPHTPDAEPRPTRGARAWFEARSRHRRHPRRRAGPRSPPAATLICAPTGGGKTLAAAVVPRPAHGEPPPTTRWRASGCSCLPLKALVHDVDRNLRAPMAGIRVAAERSVATPRTSASGCAPAMRPRSVARSGSTPDILVTTSRSTCC